MSLEIERRWVLAGRPDLSGLGVHRLLEIEQTYLRVPSSDRVRVRRIQHGRDVTYLRTAKRDVSAGVKEEIEVEITKPEYQALEKLRDPGRITIVKRRHVFEFDTLVFELDEMVEPLHIWMLELELGDPAQLRGELRLPPGLGELREVTFEPGWSNAALARRRPHPWKRKRSRH